MGRIGTHWEQCRPLIEAAAASEHIEIGGVFTHLACADVPGDDFSEMQVERFEFAIADFSKLGLPVPLRHMAASGGILHYPET